MGCLNKNINKSFNQINTNLAVNRQFEIKYFSKTKLSSDRYFCKNFDTVTLLNS